MAVAEFNGSAVQLLVQDDRGTADGGRAAAQQVLADGAEIIIGPLFAPSVAGGGAGGQGRRKARDRLLDGRQRGAEGRLTC